MNGSVQSKPLTVLQKKILRRIESGLTNREIAADLGMTETQVAYRVETIMRKLGAHTRQEAAGWTRTLPTSVRHRQVLTLLAHGKSNREIANALCIAEKTAKNHVCAVLKELGVSTRTQAAIYALKHELVEEKTA